jgi:hypothetical protein
MATSDRGLGPKIGQPVLYNNGGTIVPGIIYAVAAPTDGRVSISSFSAGTVTDRPNVVYDPNLGASKWAYPEVL